MAMEGGSGGKSGDIRAGGTYVEFYTKDNTAAGLDSAKRHVQQYAAAATASMNQAKSAFSGVKGAASQMDAATGGFIGSLARVGGAAAAVKAILSNTAAKYAEDLDRAITKGQELANQMNAMAGKRVAGAIAAVGEGFFDPAEKRAAAADALAIERDRMSGIERQLHRARAEEEKARKADRFTMFGGNVAFDFGGDLGLDPAAVARIKQATESVKQLEESYKQSQANVAALEKNLKGVDETTRINARNARMIEAEQFHDRERRIGEINMAADAAVRELRFDAASQAMRAYESLRGNFAGTFGGGSLQGAFGAQGQTRADPMKESLDVQKAILKIQEKQARDIEEIRREGPDLHGA